MTAVIHKISVGAGGKHTLSPEKVSVEAYVLGNYAHNRSRANTRAITAAETIKNAYSNASFSSVNAATESLGLSDNDFKTARKQFESSNILELGYRAACGGEGRWACSRTLCACFAL